VADDVMVVEYRMTRPFAIELEHGTCEPAPWHEDTRTAVGSSLPQSPRFRFGAVKQLRAEKAGVISSVYDLLRGEHYVRIRLIRGSSLTVEANGQRIEVAAWSNPDAKDVKLVTPEVMFRVGGGYDIVHFAGPAIQEEYLRVFARADVKQ
jgi:hypothetical protein